MDENYKSSFTCLIKNFYLFLMMLTGRELGRAELEKSAVVFAPHPDDETLGCGGTLIRKIRRGAPVDIVFLTDGCRSHRDFITENELRKMRAREAFAAAGKLGLEEEHVIFLGFENGKLAANREPATEKVRQVLLRLRPDQVFIPYRLEPPLEHSATNEIVKSALAANNLKPVILEYPIWYWVHWPWVGLDTENDGTRMEKIKKIITSWFGLRLVKEFRCSVYIGDLLDCKRMALTEHKSQMTRINGMSRWPVLGDVGGGQFLDCFFQKREVFHRCRF